MFFQKNKIALAMHNPRHSFRILSCVAVATMALTACNGSDDNQPAKSSPMLDIGISESSMEELSVAEHLPQVLAKPSESEDSFIFSIHTDANNPSFEIKNVKGASTYSVDCDDNGRFDVVDTNGSYTCTFGMGDTDYTVTIVDTSPNKDALKDLNFKRQVQLVEIKQWGNEKWESFANFLADADATISAKDIPITTRLKTTEYMFSHTTKKMVDISQWDMSNVENMSYMFKDATIFNQDIGKWNVSNAINMTGTFKGAANFNQALNWKTSRVTHMDEMFESASLFNGELKFDTSNVVGMRAMFKNAVNFNRDLKGWVAIDKSAGANGGDTGWNTSNASSFESMFEGAAKFDQDIGKWNTHLLRNTSKMFKDTETFNRDLLWETDGVTDMSETFKNAKNFSGNISTWVITQKPNVTDMYANSPINKLPAKQAGAGTKP